jgi:hypothetical protein
MLDCYSQGVAGGCLLLAATADPDARLRFVEIAQMGIGITLPNRA